MQSNIFLKRKFWYLPIICLILSVCCIGIADAQVFQRNIGKLETGMPVDEIEKVLGKKITISEDQPVIVRYNGLKLKLEFISYEVDENNRPIYELQGMSTTSEKFKTNSGIGIGNTLKEVQEMYGKYKDKQGFNVSEYENEISVFQPDYMNILTFRFKDNKVVEVKVWTADSW